MIKIISAVLLCSSIVGCSDKEQELKQLQEQEFVSIYIKKKPQHANIISRYNKCVGGKLESMEKCIFASSRNDIEVYVINDYIAAQNEYLQGLQHETTGDEK